MKGQVYGISAFMYAIAIAVVLIIGVMGLSKEFETNANAGAFRFSSIMAARSGEQVKQLLDQERGYVIDKSFFSLGAFGGYLPSDLLCNTSIDGCKSCDKPKCYPNVNDSNGQYCGIIQVNVPFLGEKYVPYWNNLGTNCKPSMDAIIDRFSIYAGQYFRQPSESFRNAFISVLGEPLFYAYNLRILNYNEDKGTIETTWSSTSDKITLKFPLDKPDVEYSFEPFVHTYSKTDFFKLYKEADYFSREGINNMFNDYNNSLLPIIVDKDFIIQNDSMSKPNYDEVSSYGPFIALADYAKSLPNTPNVCNDLTPSKNDSYDKSCYLMAERDSEGHLTKLTFDGGCKNENNDDKVMECILKRIINNIDNLTATGYDTNHSDIKPPNSNVSWRYIFNKIRISIDKIDSSNTKGTYKYNTTGLPNCRSPENIDAKCQNPYKYCPGDINLTGNVTSNPLDCSNNMYNNTELFFKISVSNIGGASSDCLAYVTPLISSFNGVDTIYKNRSLYLFGNMPNVTSISFKQKVYSPNRLKFTLNLSNPYPGDNNPLYVTNLSVCEEETTYYSSFNPLNPKLLPGNYFCNSNDQCSSGRCDWLGVCVNNCGNRNQMCCISGSLSGGTGCQDEGMGQTYQALYCNSSKQCEVCGGKDQKCCSNRNDGFQCGESLICNSTGYCEHCGNEGEKCCPPGNYCNESDNLGCRKSSGKCEKFSYYRIEGYGISTNDIFKPPLGRGEVITYWTNCSSTDGGYDAFKQACILSGNTPFEPEELPCHVLYPSEKEERVVNKCGMFYDYKISGEGYIKPLKINCLNSNGEVISVDLPYARDEDKALYTDYKDVEGASCKYLPGGLPYADWYCKCNGYQGIPEKEECYYVKAPSIDKPYNYYTWNIEQKPYLGDVQDTSHATIAFRCWK